MSLPEESLDQSFGRDAWHLAVQPWKLPNALDHAKQEAAAGGDFAKEDMANAVSDFKKARTAMIVAGLSTYGLVASEMIGENRGASVVCVGIALAALMRAAGDYKSAINNVVRVELDASVEAPSFPPGTTPPGQGQKS